MRTERLMGSSSKMLKVANPSQSGIRLGLPIVIKTEKTGQLYDSLIENIKEKTTGIKIKSVTFIWMQGEADESREC